MFDTIISLGVIALQIATVVIVIAWAVKAPLAYWVSRNASWILRVVFTGATIGSLVYSNVLGFAPCILCWYQRLAIFPVALLSYTGNLSRSALLRLQVLLFSSAGLAIALFHKYIELFPKSGLTVCGTDGIACDTLYVLKFGYITIPMMSLTVLLFGVILSLLASRFPQQEIAPSNS